MTKREKYLAHTFICVFALLAFAFLTVAVWKRIQSFNHKGSNLTHQIAEMETALKAKQVWEQRSIWLEQHAPRFDSSGKASAHLLEAIKASTIKHGLKLEEQEIHGGDNYDLVESGEVSTFYDRTTVGLIISGNERSIVEWIHELQQPTNFTGVERIAIEAGTGGLLCEVEVSQYFVINRQRLAIYD